jgi:hypothetical protein
LELPQVVMLLEFISTLTEGIRIAHPEDLLFSDGVNGAASALSALESIPDNEKNITVKWDGYPALIFGRNHDGQLVIVDKHMFLKKDGSGRNITSPEAFLQYDANRGVNRGDLYEKLSVIWPALEQTVPKTSKGYYWGDLLWTGRLSPIRGEFVFKPNTVTYRVAADSALGKRIANSVVGIVVHQWFEDFDVPAQPLNGNLGDLGASGPAVIMSPELPDTPALKKPVRLIDAAKRILNQRGNDIATLLDPITLRQNRITDLPALMQRYVNARVKGEQRNFADWLGTSGTSAGKLKTLLGENQDGYLFQNGTGVNAAFALFDAITQVKLSYIQQLDSQQSSIKASIGDAAGGEGYVFSTPEGLVKLVNRAGFSAANFAKNP